jgi:Nucleotidyl transferase AbiEii toxin, Type IV TA system
MIDRREILEAASSFSLLPSIVEKDYVLGWMLAGINAHDELGESWVFKGGTCLKKCYFETYRFSEDLDFTLRNEEHLDEEFLGTAFEEVIAWVTEQSGLNIPADQLEFDIYDNSRGRPNCQGRLGDSLARPSASDPFCCDCASHVGMGGPATAGSLSLGQRASLSAA